MGHVTSGVQIVDPYRRECLPMDCHGFQLYCAEPGQIPVYCSQDGEEVDNDHGNSKDEEEDDDVVQAEVTDWSNQVKVRQHAVAATAAEACSKHNPSSYGPKSSEEEIMSVLRSNVSPPPPPQTPPPINGLHNPAENSLEPLPYTRLQSKLSGAFLSENKTLPHTKMPAVFEDLIRPLQSNGNIVPLYDSEACFEKQNQDIWNVAAAQADPLHPSVMLEDCYYASNVSGFNELPDATFEKYYVSKGDWFDGFYESPDLVMMNTEFTSSPMVESSRGHFTSLVASPEEDHSTGDQDMAELSGSNSEDEQGKLRHHLRSCYFPPSDETLPEGANIVVNGMNGEVYPPLIGLREIIKTRMQEVLSHGCSCSQWEWVCDVHHRDALWLWEAPESEEEQLDLAQLLFACAEAVACRDAQQADFLLEQVRRLASPYGNSFQRVTACFAEGLAARMQQLGSGPGRAIVPSRTMLDDARKQDGFQLMYKHCPFLQFGHFVANCAILEALEGEKAVHVIDLGMAQWVQWPALMEALINQDTGAPPRLRITGVGGLKERMEEIGEVLKQVADKNGMEFEFRAVAASLESVETADLGLRDGEAVAVNGVLQLHRVVKESRGSLNAVLQSVYAVSPKVLTLVEQDANHNGPFFLRRFMAALHYYSAIFDSLQAALPRYSTRRVKIEQFYFAQEIHNIVACEGPARVERHERVDQWRRRMSRAGFQPSPLRLLPDARRWLAGVNATAADAYTLADEKGCLVLGWKGQPIIAASAWCC